jgi:hypothetical protein
MEQLYGLILPSISQLYLQFVLLAIAQIIVVSALVWYAAYCAIRRYQYIKHRGVKK